MKHNPTVGAFIQQQRERLGYSRYQLAAALGVPDTTVLRLEKNQIRAPRPELLMKFAKFFEISVADFFVRAGYLQEVGTHELPEFEAYLLTKYSQLSRAAIAELVQLFESLIAHVPQITSQDPYTPLLPTQEMINDDIGAAA